MNKPIVAVFTSLLMIGSAPVWCANSPVGVKVAADMWLPSTKIDNTRRDDANSPVLNLAFEHSYRICLMLVLGIPIWMPTMLLTINSTTPSITIS